MSEDEARAAALARLPAVYARALRWHGAGVSADELVLRLGIDPAALGPLLSVAEAKLAAAMADIEQP